MTVGELRKALSAYGDDTLVMLEENGRIILQSVYLRHSKVILSATRHVQFKCRTFKAYDGTEYEYDYRQGRFTS